MTTRKMRSCSVFAYVLLALAVLGSSGVATAAAGGKLIASPEADWPQFRGPQRDAISRETGLLDAWPEGGPKLLWKIAGMGKGWCSPIVAGDTLYIGGDVGEELQIFALGLDGKVKWKTANGKAWKKAFPGSRGSCCYSGGMIYQMNAHGRVVCLDAATGKEQWVVDVTKRFGGKRAFFGYSECLLVDGDNLIVTPGGPKALIAALNKKTGETVWASEGPPVAGETAGQASPILLTRGGRRQLIGNTSFRTFAVDAETGNVLWTHGLKLVKNACSTIPVLCGDSVFIINTSAKDQHTALLRIDPSGEKAEEAWTVPLSNPSASALYLDGTLYAAGASRKLEGFVALDVKTGKTTARLPEIKNASAVWAEGKFFVLSADGKALLLKPTAKGFETLGAFPVVENVKKKDAWAHPVLCNGRLYFRYHDELFCYDVKGR